MSFPATTLLDTLKRNSEDPLSNGGKWTKLEWALSAGKCFSEARGWVPSTGKGNKENTASGAYWNVTPYENPAVLMRNFQENGPCYSALWACTTGTGTKNGYRLTWTCQPKPESELGLVTMTLEKWVEGVREELATVEFGVTQESHNTAFGLTVLGGKVKGWYGATEEAMAVQVEATDSTFTEGYVGLEDNEELANGATDFRAASQEAPHTHRLEASQPQKASVAHSIAAKRSVSQAQSASVAHSWLASVNASQTQSATLSNLGPHEHRPEASQKTSASVNPSRLELSASQHSSATVTKRFDTFHATQTATQASKAALAKVIARTRLLTNVLAISLKYPRKEPIEGTGEAVASGTGVLSWKHQPLDGEGEARAVGVGYLTFVVVPPAVPPTFRDVWFYGNALRRQMPGAGEAVASGDSVLAT